MRPKTLRRPTPASAAEVEASVARIAAMSIEQLRTEWLMVRKAQAPAGLSKDLMARELAHRLQERALGGLLPELRRMLRVLAEGDEPRQRIKTGSVIVREHQGVLHEVLVLTGGFSWRGKTYPSLSTIARLITGTSWNGPRFFGLRSKRGKNQRTEAAEIEPARPAKACPRRGRRSSVHSSLPRPSLHLAKQPDGSIGARAPS